MKSTKQYIAALSTILALSLTAVPTLAQTGVNPYPRQPGNGNWRGMGMSGSHPGVAGIVTAVNGSTLTVQSRGFGRNMATTTYTVDASHATVTKNNATSSLSAVAVNDRVFIQGAVTGTNVVATVIRDGIMGMGQRPGNKPGSSNGSASTSMPIQGNGQPVVAGTVSAVNGTMLSITTASNTSYTVDAANATVSKGGSSSQVSAIAVGDYLVVQGPVNGSSVTANSIIDQSSGAAKPADHGFLGSIGQFFKRLFGF
jgi:hypothetical protein